MTETRARLDTALRDRYRVVRELGRGGAAVVWLVDDLKHRRQVALKVLHPQVAATIGPERFLREIRFAARLQHPHILTVLDSGETDGLFWFTMPFVEGESIREQLQRGRLSLDESLNILREAALGLQYAHEHGVVHRDIKPENILRTRDGMTLVTDFGIARSVDAVDGDTELTVVGLAIGTPAYMSPEQATGSPDVDARSDIYSLAAIGFEMLTGAPPHSGATPAALIGRRLSEPPPRVRISRPEIPLGVEDALLHALAVSPDERFPTMRAFADALETGRTSRLDLPTRRRRRRASRALVAAVTIAAFAAGAFAWTQRPQAPAIRRLAVLPFENLGDSADAYFADGITDAVRSKLASLPELRVTAWNSSSQYRTRPLQLRAIARQLNVDYLLVGRVRWVRDGAGTSRVQVSPELVDAATETVAWQDGFDASLTDVFRVQSDVAGRVVDAMHLALGADDRARLVARPTTNLPAYDAYLKGEAAAQQMASPDPAGLIRAVNFYERAVALDSTFLEAWAQLARARSYLAFVSGSSAENTARAQIAASRASALAHGRPEGALARGYFEQMVRGDAAAAIVAFDEGLRIAPGNADLLSAESAAERDLGRWDDALLHARQAVSVDPRSARAESALSYVLLWLRRHDEALAACRRARQLAPNNIDLIQLEAMIRVAQGDLAAARAVVTTIPSGVAEPTVIAYIAVYFDMYWVLDDRQQQQLLRMTADAFEDHALWALALAQTWSLRGNAPQARAYADSARITLEHQLAMNPQDGQRRMSLATAYSYLDRHADAIREGQRSLASVPMTRDAWTGGYLREVMAHIQLRAGDRDAALALLTPLLGMPSMLSPGWLRVDPSFDALAGMPRFERLRGVR